jgi:hypothetical protein
MKAENLYLISERKILSFIIVFKIEKQYEKTSRCSNTFLFDCICKINYLENNTYDINCISLLRRLEKESVELRS